MCCVLVMSFYIGYTEYSKMVLFQFVMLTSFLLQLTSTQGPDFSEQFPQVTCPSGCFCMPTGSQGYITECQNQDFTSVPGDLPVNSSQIYLKGNHILTIGEGDFDRFPYLRLLSITECRVQDLQSGSFSNLRELNSLDLKGNRVGTLKQNIFAGLTKLQKIVLDSNRLTTIEDLAFSGVGSEDEGVSMSIKDNPDLSVIQRQAFEGANIQELIIQGASLTSSSMLAFEALQGSLQLLFLQDNRVPLTIPATVFTGFKFMVVNLARNGIHDSSFLEHLTTSGLSLADNPLGPVNYSQYASLANTRDLHLGNTNFHTLKADYFRGLNGLTDLNLSNNSITSLPESLQSIFRRLSKLSLAGNPLHCNCDLSWFRSWLNGASNKVEGAECVTPFKASPLSSVNLHKFTCTPPTAVQITSQPDGGRAVLICKAKGDPPPTLIWTMPSGKHIVAQPLTSQNFTGKTKAQLPLTDEDKSGVYSCEAKNGRGSSSDSLKVDVYKAIALARSDHISAASSLYLNNLCLLPLTVMAWLLVFSC